MHDAQMSTWAAMARRDRNFDRIRPTCGKGWRPFLSVGPKIVKKLARMSAYPGAYPGLSGPIRDFPENSEISPYPALSGPIRSLSGPIRAYPGLSGRRRAIYPGAYPEPIRAYPGLSGIFQKFLVGQVFQKMA